MWYVYLLESADKEWHYYGFTSDLKRRYKEHTQGKVITTKHRLPLVLRYYEAYDVEDIARSREATLKRSRSATKAILQRINNT